MTPAARFARARADAALHLASGAARDPGRRDGSRRNRIRYDASRFAVVEVDATFYGLPIAATSQRWVERTPDDAHARHQWSTFQPSETKRLREAVF